MCSIHIPKIYLREYPPPITIRWYLNNHHIPQEVAMIKFSVYQIVQQPDDKLLFQLLASFYSYDEASAYADAIPDLNTDIMAYDDDMDIEFDEYEQEDL